MNLRSLCLRYSVFIGIVLGLSFSKAPADSNGDLATSFIGVCSQVTRESKLFNPYSIHQELMDSIKTANSNFTRTGFPWSVIHPTHDQWDWRISDAVVASAKQKDLKILALLTGMPKWVMASPENEIDLWTEFVDSLTSRYKEDIFHWEIWNEPNLISGKYWPQNKLPELFATYTFEAASVIRRNQPDATILLGGLATGRKSNPFGLWTSLFELGVLNAVDGIAYHTYQYTGVDLIDFNKRLSALVSEYTKEKKEYWITEYGVPAIDSNRFPKFTYEAKSKSLLTSILVHWATGGEQFFIFSIWDKAVFNPDDTDKELRKKRSYYFGLLEKDFSPKPSYAAVNWLSPLLTVHEPVGLQRLSSGVIIMARHKATGKMVYFSWGRHGHQELFKTKGEKNLISVQSSAFQFDLTRTNWKGLNKSDDHVLFWQ